MQHVAFAYRCPLDHARHADAPKAQPLPAVACAALMAGTLDQFIKVYQILNTPERVHRRNLWAT